MKKEIKSLAKKLIKHIGVTTVEKASMYACYEPKISEALKMAIKNNQFNTNK